MVKRFVANLHASLESTCRSRFSKISTRCQNLGESQSSFTMFRLNLNWKILGDIVISPFSNDWGVKSCISRTYSKLTFSKYSQLMGNKFVVNLHASLKSTCKIRISKISPRCQNLEGRSQSSFIMSRLNLKWKILGDILLSQIGGSIIFQLLILNSEM